MDLTGDAPVRDASFREMVKKKREEVKAVTSSSHTIQQKRRDSESLARSRSSTLISKAASQSTLKAPVTMSSNAAPPAKLTKKGHQVPRKDNSGISLLQQAATSWLKTGPKKSFPTIRANRSQSMSLGPDASTSSSTTFSPQPSTVPKRVYKQPPEQPLWNGSRTNAAVPTDGKRNPSSLSRAASGNALDRGSRPETPKNGERYSSRMSFSESTSKLSHRISSADLVKRKSNSTRASTSDISDDSSTHSDSRRNKRYPSHSGPPFYITQAYRLPGPLNIHDLALAINKVCTSYKVLCTRFWRNEKIVDADVEEYPDLAVLKPHTLAKFIKREIDALDRIEKAFQVVLVREPILDGRKQPIAFFVMIATTAFRRKRKFNLYFDCAKFRQTNDSDFQIGADDFIDVAYNLPQPRQGHLFWKEMCIETVQDSIDGPERDDIESQLKKILVEVENLRTQVQSLSKRKVEVEAELGTLTVQRRQMEVESFESAERVIEISKTAKIALIRTVLGEEAVTDNVSALLAKHEVAQDIQRHIGHMSLEVFSQITEDQLDRRKILALSEYSLQEQTKVNSNVSLICARQTSKTAQKSLDANDDMSIRLKVLLNPPTIDIKDIGDEYGYHNRYGFQPIDVDFNVLKNIRQFRDRCRQTHKQRLLNLRKGNLLGSGGEMSDFSSTEESNPPSEVEDNIVIASAGGISSDSGVPCSFPSDAKTHYGCDCWPIIRDHAVTCRPDKEGTYLQLSPRLRRSGCPYATAAKKLKLPETFPIQFEFVTDREMQQFKYVGMEVGEVLPTPYTTRFEIGREQICVEKVWSVDEQACFDVKLVLVEEAETIRGGILYRRDKFDEDKIAKWVSKYQTTLEGIEVGSRDVAISSLISRYYSSVFLNDSQGSLNSLNSQSSSDLLSRK
ncbi:hypothetical protein BC829DRAFT_387130 [Chytridium lagenaria]|nr:hypothetical protein BC829DRAFT_387130 [Chytridium lagenaria]